MNLIVVEGVRRNICNEEQTPQCLLLYRARLVGQIKSVDEDRSVCIFSAPDAESVRRALRSIDCAFTHAWPSFTYQDSEHVVPDRAIVLSNNLSPNNCGEDASYLDELEQLKWMSGEFALAYASLDRARLIVLFASDHNSDETDLPETFKRSWSIENHWRIL